MCNLAKLIALYGHNGFYAYGFIDKYQWSVIQNQAFPTK